MKQTYIAIITTALLSFTTLNIANAHDTHHGMHNASQSAQTKDLIQATGVIKHIDLDNNKVTIAHDAIPALNWPEMVMRFTANDVALIESLKVDDKVSFIFSQQGSLSILDSITVVH